MSTRSIIAARLSDGTIKAIYVHFDGYGHLPILQENYNSQEAVEALISLGNLSGLKETLLSCRAYGRDIGRLGEQATVLASLEEAKDLDWGQEYIYAWDGSQWTMTNLCPNDEEEDDEEHGVYYSEDDLINMDWDLTLQDYDKGILSREAFLALLKERLSVSYA